MAFQNIQDIRYAALKSQLYFFDTNVWLAFIAQIDSGTSKKPSLYVKFFNDLLDSVLIPTPKVFLCNVQVSEIINAYLRQIAMKRYMLEHNTGNQGSDYYKMVYRNSEHFQRHHKLIRDEIKGYRPFIETTDDFYNAIGPYNLIDEVSTKMDYNDYYYYKLCVEIQKSGKVISIITHDQDFKFKDIPIITDNSALKNLRYT